MRKVEPKSWLQEWDEESKHMRPAFMDEKNLALEIDLNQEGI